MKTLKTILAITIISLTLWNCTKDDNKAQVVVWMNKATSDSMYLQYGGSPVFIVDVSNSISGTINTSTTIEYKELKSGAYSESTPKYGDENTASFTIDLGKEKSKICVIVLSEKYWGRIGSMCKVTLEANKCKTVKLFYDKTVN